MLYQHQDAACNWPSRMLDIDVSGNAVLGLACLDTFRQRVSALVNNSDVCQHLMNLFLPTVASSRSNYHFAPGYYTFSHNQFLLAFVETCLCFFGFMYLFCPMKLQMCGGKVAEPLLE